MVQLILMCCFVGLISRSSSAWTPEILHTYVPFNRVNNITRGKLIVDYIDQRVVYNHYEVHLTKINQTTEPKALKCSNSERQFQHRTRVILNRNRTVFDDLTPGHYCIVIKPADENENRNCTIACNFQMSKVVFIEDPPVTSFSLRIFQFCETWNGNVFIRGFVEKASITAKFVIFPEYSSCFKSYNIYLINTEICNITSVTPTDVKKNISSERSVSFDNLKPGSYCVQIEPIENTLGAYRKLYSHLCTLVKAPENDTMVLELPDVEPKYLLWVLVPVTAATLGLFTICYVLHCKRTNKASALDAVSSEQQLIEGTATRVKPKIKVFLLYLHESPEFEELVSHFAEFLKNCCKIDEVQLDVDNEVDIRIEGIQWMIRMLNTYLFETSEDEDTSFKKKIIVIDSPRCESASCIDNDAYNFVLNEVSRYGFNTLTLYFESLVDYKHLIVVRFTFTPESAFLRPLVPNRRFSLPDHLCMLCSNLHNDSNIVFGPNAHSALRDQWKNQDSYQKLLNAINEMDVASTSSYS